jgi:signal transduction histidine kinase
MESFLKRILLSYLAALILHMPLYRSLLLSIFFVYSITKPCFGQAEAPTPQRYYVISQGDVTVSFDKKLKKLTQEQVKLKETSDGMGLVAIQNELGFAYLTDIQDYERAMDAFVRALQLEDSLRVDDERFYTYMGIAQVFQSVGDYYKSLQFLQEALVESERLTNKGLLVIVLNKMGQVQMALGHMAEAFENFDLIIEYDESSGNRRATAEARFHRANLYSHQRSYTKALDNHKSALSYWRSVGDRHHEAKSLEHIGNVYGLMDNKERSLANHTAALEVRQAIQDKSGIASSYNTIGNMYLQQGNADRAVANLDLALTAGREAQDQEAIRTSYEHLSAAYEAAGDYKKALEYKDLFLAINEFIANEKNDRQLSETQFRYTLSQKETQITNLESEREQREKELVEQKKFRNVLLALVGLAFAVAILGIYLYIVKRQANRALTAINETVRKQNEELQQLNATKDKFFSIISHDLKGPLNSLSSFSGLLINHTDSLSKEDIQMLAKDLDKSLKNLFALLENLLDWARSQTGVIEFKPEPVNLANLLNENKALLEGQAGTKRIAIQTNYSDNIPVLVHKNSVTTVIRNLVSNAIKFTPEGGTITLQAGIDKGFANVSIIDTGVGMSQEVIAKLFRIDTKHSTKGTANEKGTGLGLILCKEFIEKNGGTIGVTSEEGNGSVFYFTVPMMSH